ncbi:Sulfotransferase domain protein [Maioricimonas rarisocia]|uniref:Sulfotransferase domain protein n=1 Tax=Maioricimonas rarisocia TaxID=2528026 RepID=A0A517ZD70_9PLAN|nr:sulfotransferase domain-containing protein [Maioricimonas rarisocia]QDU40409.1 Sulfotransferase domain protein [Maioricimonas rarisocia]
MILPNVVIAGTPKSGSTSLFRWLSDHPQVCSSARKETRILLDRGDPQFCDECNYHDHGLAAYESLFPESSRSSSRPVRLEATPHYLYHDTALRVLSGLDEIPHIVILLRKPSDRIYSSFRYTQNNLGLLPRRLSFGEYVERLLSEDSLSGEPLARPPLVWRELRYSRYADDLRRWQEAFPPDRLHVLLFEELVRSPAREVAALAAAIGIDDTFYANYAFPRCNESYCVRVPELQRPARRSARVLPVGRMKAAVQEIYLKLQRRPRETESLTEDQAALRKLDATLASANAELCELLGRNLDVWELSDVRLGVSQRESLGTSAR